MRWYEVMDALVARCAANLAGVVVIRSADAATPRECTVIIRRGTSNITRDIQLRTTEFALLVECWEHDEDRAEADQRLADLEDRVVEQINGLIRDQRQGGLQLDTTLSIEPDGDYFRPSVASQITANFRARERRPITPI